MYAASLLTWNRWKPTLRAVQSASIPLFGLGLFLGIVAVSMWRQWSLTFGQDSRFLLAVSLVFALSCWLGQRWNQIRGAVPDSRSVASLIFCLAAWSTLHPFWIDSLTVFMSFLPLACFENGLTKPILVMLLAILGWIVPGILWFASIAQGSCLLRGTASSNRQTISIILCGITFGLLLDSLVLAPWFGVFVPTVVASILASAGGAWLRLQVRVVERTPVVKSVELNGQFATSSLRAGMVCLAAGLLACNLRLVNQLMPHGAFVIDVQMAGVLLGVACGLLLASFQRSVSDRAAWGALFAAAASSLLLALQPTFVDLSLQVSSSITTVPLLLAVRSLLLMVVACPFGIALAWMADSMEDDSASDLVSWGAPIALGLGIAMFLLSRTVGLIPMMALCGGLLVICAGFLRIRLSVNVLSMRNAFGMAGLAVIAVSLPIWRNCDDASRTAKMLFSMPSFVAYRNGWEMQYLPHLDDVRMIDRVEGRSGPLTLWRGRVAELYLRDAGLPRAMVTRSPEAVPQYPPEVLQAVYSLVIADRPGRILLLGLSAGVPLSTCLDFPIREAVCVEGDSSLIELVRGPLARETGLDPFNDDRVTLRQVSPEVALMAKFNEPFDVILSSPSASSMTEGSASFTQEFYQRASRHLSQRGLFCQRFECIDYGPKPILSVVKAMQSAFRRVIAVETSPGELLLFAANADDVFIPGDLANRLETSHVRKILARSGIDWSALLNQSAYDDAVLREICDEFQSVANSSTNGRLAASAPMEVMRWGNKQQEVQTMLTAVRTSPASFWSDANGQPKPLKEEVHLSRRSRLVEWLGDAQTSQELLRRIGEVVTQQNLVRENPDVHWWKYRNTLRKQLQDRPRTAVQQIKAIDEGRSLHPEDVRRLDYFTALGNAAKRVKPTREQIAAVEEYLEPYDPLISYFARQETADMLARSGEDTAQELAYRLYVIYFAPTLDASVRNVAAALTTLVEHPETIPDASTRYDALNGLIQTLRIRWEIRQSVKETSSKSKILSDVDQSLVAVEKGVASMDPLAVSIGMPEREWQIRKQVIERLMIRPLRTYRTAVQSHLSRGQAEARAILDEAAIDDDDAE